MKKADHEIVVRLRGLGYECGNEWTLCRVAEMLRVECDIHIWVETRFDGQTEHLYYIGFTADFNGGNRMVEQCHTPKCDDHDTALALAINKGIDMLSKY